MNDDRPTVTTTYLAANSWPIGVFKTSLIALCLLAIASGAQAQLTGQIDIDISGLPTGGSNSAADEVLVVDLGTGGRDAVITGTGYNVTIEAFEPSFLSHAAIQFGSDFAFMTTPAGNPGFGGDDFFGIGSYSSDGIEDLTMIPLPDGSTFDLSFTAPGGLLELRLTEWADDESVSPDGMWQSPSTISVTYSYVPEPASNTLFGMMSLGLLCLLRPKRSDQSSAMT